MKKWLKKARIMSNFDLVILYLSFYVGVKTGEWIIGLIR